MKPIKIGFFGTPALAATVLRDIIEDKTFEVSFVVTNPDKPVGRSAELRPSPVKEIASENNLPVFQPEKIRWNEQFLNDVRSFWCDYFVVVAYGKILPKELLDIPTKKSINVHGSILPKYRWASPVQSALLFGERETGVTIMEMDEQMDTGNMIHIEKIAIHARDTSETLFEKFQNISGRALINGIKGLEDGTLIPIPQDHDLATYCSKIQKEDGLIDWQREAEHIYHTWQAYTPWPGIYTFLYGKRLILEDIIYTEDNHGKTPWSVFLDTDNVLSIATGKWSICPKILKLEGKKSQDVKTFLNGNPDFIDITL